MNENLKKGDYEEATFAILDVNRKKLYENTNLDKTHLSLLEGEAYSFVRIWESI